MHACSRFQQSDVAYTSPAGELSAEGEIDKVDTKSRPGRKAWLRIQSLTDAGGNNEKRETDFFGMWKGVKWVMVVK